MNKKITKADSYYLEMFLEDVYHYGYGIMQKGRLAAIFGQQRFSKNIVKYLSPIWEKILLKNKILDNEDIGYDVIVYFPEERLGTAGTLVFIKIKPNTKSNNILIEFSDNND